MPTGAPTAASSPHRDLQPGRALRGQTGQTPPCEFGETEARISTDTGTHCSIQGRLHWCQARCPRPGARPWSAEKPPEGPCLWLQPPSSLPPRIRGQECWVRAAGQTPRRRLGGAVGLTARLPQLLPSRPALRLGVLGATGPAEPDLHQGHGPPASLQPSRQPQATGRPVHTQPGQPCHGGSPISAHQSQLPRWNAPGIQHPHGVSHEQ